MYSFIKILSKIIFRLFFRLKIRGLENVDEGETYIIAANHISNFDPLLVACLLKKRIVFLGKKELFKNKLSNFIFSKLGVISIDRGKADIKAIRDCIKVLKDKKSLLIFPEGTRSRGNDENQAKNGIYFIAEKSSVKILPVFIKTDYKIFRDIEITFREPVDIAKKDIDIMSTIRG